MHPGYLFLSIAKIWSMVRWNTAGVLVLRPSSRCSRSQIFMSKDNRVRVCYDTARGLQLCFSFYFHVSPLPPHVACHPRAWPQRMTCDLASHDQQSGPLACGACRRVSLGTMITVPSSTLTYGPLRLCQHTIWAYRSRLSWTIDDNCLSPNGSNSNRYHEHSHRSAITIHSFLTYHSH